MDLGKFQRKWIGGLSSGLIRKRRRRTTQNSHKWTASDQNFGCWRVLILLQMLCHLTKTFGNCWLVFVPWRKLFNWSLNCGWSCEIFPTVLVSSLFVLNSLHLPFLHIFFLCVCNCVCFPLLKYILTYCLLLLVPPNKSKLLNARILESETEKEFTYYILRYSVNSCLFYIYYCNMHYISVVVGYSMAEDASHKKLS